MRPVLLQGVSQLCRSASVPPADPGQLVVIYCLYPATHAEIQAQASELTSRHSSWNNAMSITSDFKCTWAHFELTSNCNLACVYCAVSQPWYQGVNMAAEKATSVTEWLLANNVPNININGHGETTILPLWPQIIKPLLNSSAKCHLITNAAKQFSESEIDALCRLTSITISCDTFDSQLYSRLRRKSSIRNVLRGIAGIRAAAKKRRLKPPSLILSCVLGAENSDSLEDLILTAYSMGFYCIQLCSLTDYPLPPGAEFKLNPISTLPRPKLVKLREILTAYTSPESMVGAKFLSVHPGIISDLDAALS